MTLERRIVDFGRYPQHLVWIAFVRTHVARFDIGELCSGEPKAPGCFSQEFLLVGMEHTVRHRDVEETVNHVL